mmetsp:Transcript_87054/g.244135  ORF Transcript_87054/g.244135 Transcript_87054/m.244135 type:complete len:240 (+) Transcript_87054:123-842(+)
MALRRAVDVLLVVVVLPLQVAGGPAAGPEVRQARGHIASRAPRPANAMPSGHGAAPGPTAKPQKSTLTRGAHHASVGPHVMVAKAPPTAESSPAVPKPEASKTVEDEKTTKEKIWEMGKDLCKKNSHNPLCKQFLDDEIPSTTTSVTTTKATTSAAITSATTTPATTPPTAAPMKVPETTAKVPLWHVDGETVTGDWHKEYPKPAAEAHDALASEHSGAASVGACVALQVLLALGIARP